MYRETVKIMDRFGIDSNGLPNLLIPDTTFYEDKKISAIGAFAIDRNGKKSKYKIGR